MFQERLKVSVYYEALCPESKRVVSNEVDSALKLLGTYLDFDLIPYGHAEVSGLYLVS